MDWLQITYQPTALFSLKPSAATSTGGKSLLLPSPFAFKMALLDVAIRTSGLNQAKDNWPIIRDLQLGIQLPSEITVTNLFGRILRQKEIKSKASEKPAKILQAKAKGQWPYQRTIGYREYVYFRDPLTFALGFEPSELIQQSLRHWLLQINYLGKRGGFVQPLHEAQPVTSDELAPFIMLTAEQKSYPIQGVMQMLDDCDPKTKFEQVDIYTTKRPKRIVRHLVLPYKVKRSSRSYTLYEHI